MSKYDPNKATYQRKIGQDVLLKNRDYHRAHCRCLENSSFEDDRIYLKFPRRTWSKEEVPSYSVFSMPTCQLVEETH